MASSKTRSHRQLITDNRRARFEYEILETLEAGISLLGPEVKSLRKGSAHLNEAYVRFDTRGRAVLADAHIAPYNPASRENAEPTRERPLLLHSDEILRLRQKVKEKGLSLIPLQMYFLGPWAKIEIGLGRGKKLHDKRASIKEAEGKREAARAMRRN